MQTTTNSNHRLHGYLSAAAGILLLISAFLTNDWGNVRGILPAVAGVLWLVIGFSQFRKAART